jgi:hypothetical protein
MESVNQRHDAPAAGHAEPESRSLPRGSAARAEVVRLVRERRYEEALGLLYQARAEDPANAELQASIAQIKEFLAGAYAKKLGGLDRVAPPVPAASGRSPDEIMVARFADGISNFEDICQMSPLGRLRTLQVLIALYQGPSAAPPVASTPPPPAVEPETPPTKRTGVASAPAPNAAPSSAPAKSEPPRVESEEDRRYHEAFARGTAAFVQRRYADAVDAFRACTELRPEDGQAQVMLRWALRDYGG